MNSPLSVFWKYLHESTDKHRRQKAWAPSFHIVAWFKLSSCHDSQEMSCIIYSKIIQSKTFSLDLCFFVEMCMAAGLLNICVHTFIWYLEWLFSVK